MSCDSVELSYWPEGGIESLACCPVCGSKRRSELHSGLTDAVFNCAPGRWDLQRCLDCECAYLSPRPSAETIHLAYRNYYTHNVCSRGPSEMLHGIKRLQRKMANAYRNWRFGTSFNPYSALGVLAAFALPSKRVALDREFRHLPRLAGKGRLLDVGFGDASFLALAQAAGWEAEGVDPDRSVVESARDRGLKVYEGGLEALHPKSEIYDVVTLSHVIEHVHDPRSTLEHAYRLLKPGGLIWLETPNISSFGHDWYGRHWRGLEPPRHLVIFNRMSIEKLLTESGFCGIRHRATPNAFVPLAMASEAIKYGTDPRAAMRPSLRIRLVGSLAWIHSRIQQDKSEFLTLTAIKPDRGIVR